MKVLFWMFIGFDKHTTSEHLLAAIIKQLCEKGHTVHIVQKNTGGELPSVPDNLKGEQVTTDVIPFKSANKENFITRYLNELKYIYQSKKCFTNEYDAVFIQSTTVGGFAVHEIKKRIPKAIVTFNVQDIFPCNAGLIGSIKRNGFLYKCLSSIQRYAYKHSDHIITISEDMKDTLVKEGVKPEKLQVVYNWSYQDQPYSELKLAQPVELLKPGYYHVVYAGNLGHMQAVGVLVEAAKILKAHTDIWFDIIGEGVYKQKLKEMVEKYGLNNISIMDMQAPDMAPAIYRYADINVIPLAKDVYKTALPSKTATCLACGKPIIFAIGKESKYGRKVSHETGCIVIDTDAAQLAESILNIKRDEYKIDTIGIFMRDYQKTVNSRRYAELITSKF